MNIKRILISSAVLAALLMIAPAEQASAQAYGGYYGSSYYPNSNYGITVQRPGGVLSFNWGTPRCGYQRPHYRPHYNHYRPPYYHHHRSHRYPYHRYSNRYPHYRY